MRSIILISGKRCSGKDHFAQCLKQYLESQGTPARVVSFADAVKREYAKKTPKVTFEMLKDRKIKEQHRPGIIELAMRMREERGTGFWAWALFHYEFRSQNSEQLTYILSDWRFLEELHVAEDWSKNIIKVRMNAPEELRKHWGWIPNPTIDGHISETALDLFMHFNFVFYNDNTGDMQDWGRQVAILVSPRQASEEEFTLD